jgi:hypothetical protein
MLVYFLMMADDIKSVFGFLAIALGLATIACFLGRAISSSMVYEHDVREQTSDWRVWQTWVAFTKRIPWLFAIAVVFNTFMPGTKTIAAMVVLPKLTSPAALDAMGNEAKELYGLAKDALRNLAGDDKQAKADK